jgi:Cu+-exporting ATPase
VSAQPHAPAGPAAQPEHPLTRIDLQIGGMTCAACAARVRKKLSGLDGVSAEVNFATERATVLAPPQVPAEMLVAVVESTGYTATPVRQAGGIAGADDGQASARAAYLRRRLVVAAILFLPLSDLSGALSLFPAVRFPGWQWVLIPLAAPVVGWAAWPFHRAAIISLRHGVLTMDTLVSLGITAATAWSLYAMFVLDPRSISRSARYELIHASGGGIYLEVAAAVTTFLLAGRFFEARGRRTAGEAMRELAASGARDVCVVDAAGTTRWIPVAELQPGDTFMVRPGEKIAADGDVIFGQSEIDRSMLTGESLPADVAAGDTVTAGTLAVSGRLIVRAVKVGSDTQLAHLIQLVEDAQGQKAAIQRLADKISGVFVPAVLVLAVATLTGWLAAGAAPARAFGAGLAVLIIACPCSLGLATPAALIVACGRGARLGIFIKGYPALESSCLVDTVVLDKTGTVTTGSMSVTGIALADGTSRADFLRRAGAVEQASEHSVAAAVTSAALAEAGELPVAEHFTALPGLGAAGQVEDAEVIVGRERLLRQRRIEIPAALTRQAHAWEAGGMTVVLGGWDGQAHGAIAIADAIKPSAAAAIAELRRLALHTILLTGDNQATADAIGARAGVDEVRAGALPADKAAFIRGLQSRGHRVAMVGDGINDGPALAAADLALALGSGTDVAISAADLIVLRDSLLAVPESILLSRATYRVIRRNLAWAFGYNAAAIPLASAGLLNPLIAAAAMTLSSAFVLGNSLRLRRVPLSGAPAARTALGLGSARGVA